MDNNYYDYQNASSQQSFGIQPIVYEYSTNEESFPELESSLFLDEWEFDPFYVKNTARFKDRIKQDEKKNLTKAVIGDYIYHNDQVLGIVSRIDGDKVYVKKPDGKEEELKTYDFAYRAVQYKQEGGSIDIQPIKYEYAQNNLIDLPIDPLSPYNFGEAGKIEEYELPIEELIAQGAPEDQSTQELQEEPQQAEEKKKEEKKKEEKKEQKKVEDKTKLTSVQEAKPVNPKLLAAANGQPKGRFPKTEQGKVDFLRTMYYNYSKILKEKGLDPRLAYVLTASASIEAAWGVSPSGHYNYGGIKVTDAQIRKGVPYLSRLTTDWTPQKGYHRHYQNFRSYASIEDYCRKRIELLMGKRYRIQTLDPSRPIQLWGTILDRGYAVLPAEGRAKYLGWVKSRMNKLKKVLQ